MTGAILFRSGDVPVSTGLLRSGKRVEDPRCASLKNGEMQVIANETELVAA